MKYVGTFLNSKGQEVRHTFEAGSEDELRQRLQKDGYDIKSLKIDGTSQVADAQAILDFSSKFIFGVVLVLLAAILLSMPFPFVRKIWFREVWGYYGPINAACFLTIAFGLRRRSVIAVVCGMAILFYEQYLTWQGFYYFYKNGILTPKIIYFITGAAALTLLLLFAFLKALHAIQLYYGVKWELGGEQNASVASPSHDQVLRCGIFALYLVAPALIYWLPLDVNSREYLAALRHLAEWVCLISAAGIGYEIQKSFKKHGFGIPSWGIIFFHLIALVTLGNWIFSKLPPIDEVFRRLS